MPNGRLFFQAPCNLDQAIRDHAASLSFSGTDVVLFRDGEALHSVPLIQTLVDHVVDDLEDILSGKDISVIQLSARTQGVHGGRSAVFHIQYDSTVDDTRVTHNEWIKPDSPERAFGNKLYSLIIKPDLSPYHNGTVAVEQHVDGKKDTRSTVKLMRDSPTYNRDRMLLAAFSEVTHIGDLQNPYNRFVDSDGEVYAIDLAFIDSERATIDKLHSMTRRDLELSEAEYEVQMKSALDQVYQRSLAQREEIIDVAHELVKKEYPNYVENLSRTLYSERY